LLHEAGHLAVTKNDSTWLIEQFESGSYIGLPLLEWMGLCLSPERAQATGQAAFPHMLRWLRKD
jgi:hypothetical protein